MTVLAARRWATNAELIEDVAALGYLNGRVLDATYGLGTFWKKWRPDQLTISDINPELVKDGYAADFTDLPWPDLSFDSVVLDPPYKLNGTPTDAVDKRYGVHIATPWQDRHQLIRDGMTECARVTRRYLLLKCMNQVVSGKKRWQDNEFTNHATSIGLDLVDRFDMLVSPRPQPSGRQQKHAQGATSILLVFEK